jgi:maltose O-acetyltransferase
MDAILPGQADGTVAPVTLKRGCYLGAGCIILPGVTVGERAVVGAGAVVTRDVPAGKVVVGAPARAVRDIGPLA